MICKLKVIRPPNTSFRVEKVLCQIHGIQNKFKINPTPEVRGLKCLILSRLFRDLGILFFSLGTINSCLYSCEV